MIPSKIPVVGAILFPDIDFWKCTSLHPNLLRAELFIVVVM